MVGLFFLICLILLGVQEPNMIVRSNAVLQESLRKVFNKDKYFFEENGYVGPFPLPSQGTISQLEQVFRDKPRFSSLSLRKKSTRKLPAKTEHISSSAVFALATEIAILEDVSVLLGPDLLLWVGETIRKSPFNPGKIWHIDLVNTFVGGIHASVAITDMNLKNGCLQVIPKTHTYNVDPREFAQKGKVNLRDSRSMLQLADHLHPENAPHEVVPVEMKAGEYFFTKGGLWHCVGPNRTLNSRMAVVARYAKPSVEVKYPRGCHFPCILVKGEDRYGVNRLYSPPE